MKQKKQNSLLLIGSMNLGNIADDGETIKNQLIGERLENEGFKAVRIDTRNRFIRPYYLFKLAWNILTNKNQKIILSASILVAFKLLKVIKFLGYDDSLIYYWVIGGALSKKILNKEVPQELIKNIKVIIVEGIQIKQELESIGFKNVIYKPNFKKISYIPEISAKIDDKTKFVFISRIIPDKGVDYILEAIQTLMKESIRNFSVDFYGPIGESYKEDFLKKINGCDNVSYKGFLDLTNEKGYDILASYDCMLFPTYWKTEGFPGILIDASIAGLPVIASDWNLNSSVIKDKYNGFLIPVHSCAALTDCMRKIIIGKIKLDQMKTNAQNMAMNFDMSKVVSHEFLKEIDLAE